MGVRGASYISPTIDPSLPPNTPHVLPTLPNGVMDRSGQPSSDEFRTRDGSHRDGTKRRTKRRHDPLALKKHVWHFGLRSINPPMEVIYELYKSLRRLNVEWRGKRGVWASSPQFQEEVIGGQDIPREDLDIYTLDIRCRKRDTVVCNVHLL